VKKQAGTESTAYAGELAGLGLNLVHQRKYEEAELTLRETLVLREQLQVKKLATPWQVANVKSMLGEALLGQKKFNEAEPLLVAGYEGLKQNEKSIPEFARYERMTEAIQRLIDLATARNSLDQLKKWEAEKANYRPLAPMPREKK
jgi:hypothetical protein